MANESVFSDELLIEWQATIGYETSKHINKLIDFDTTNYSEE